MRHMKKITDAIKGYSFFDPFPTTNYFAYVPQKSNEERMLESALEINTNARRALIALRAQLLDEYGEEVLGGTEELFKIFITRERCKAEQIAHWGEIASRTECQRYDSGRGTQEPLGCSRSIEGEYGNSTIDPRQKSLLRDFAYR